MAYLSGSYALRDPQRFALVKQQVDAFLKDRQQHLNEGYDASTGYKFGNAADAAAFSSALGGTKNLKAGQYFQDKSGTRYALIDDGGNSTPPGSTEIGSVSSVLADPYATVDNNAWKPTSWVNDAKQARASGQSWNAMGHDELFGKIPAYGGGNKLKVVKLGGSSAAPQAAEPPKEFTPSADLVAARERAQAYSDSSGGDGGRLAAGGSRGRWTDDLVANMNTLDTRAQGYQRRFLDRFLPSLQANAEVASREVGEAGRDALGRLDPAIKPPTFSNPFTDTTAIDDKSLFAQLQKRIKEA